MVPFGLLALHIAAFFAWDWTARFNTYTGATLQLFGAWWVFYAVSEQIGLNLFGHLTRGANDVLSIIWRGGYSQQANVGSMHASLGVVGGEARVLISPKPALTTAGKLKQLEQRFEHFEREVIAWNSLRRKQSDELRADLDAKIDSIRIREAEQGRKVEAQHRGVMKAEAAGLLVFTHGLLTSTLTQ